MSQVEETQAIDELKTAVHALQETVADYRAQSVDREMLENVIVDVLAKQDAADKRRSFRPSNQGVEDLEALGLDGAKRLDALMSRRAADVAPFVRQSREDIERFQRTSDQLLIVSAITGKKPKETRFYSERFLPELNAAVNTDNAGQGADWVPRELSPNLIDRVELQLKVVGLFQSVPMPTQPYDLPGRAVSRTKLAQGVQNDADTAQTGMKKIQIASRKVTFSAKKFWGEALVSKEAEEDAIMAQLPLIESELQRFMAYDIEDTAINGDTAGTQDTGWAADDPRKNWDGLRKLALAAAKTDFAGAKLTVSGLRGNRKKMGKYGVDPNELAHILSINEYIDILDDTAVLTLEKYGPQATVLRGELGSVDSVPIIVSEAMRTDLNVSGVFDNVTKTRTVAITVYRPGFGVGERRGLTIQILRELYAEYDQDAVTISVRRAFQPLQPATTEPIVAVTYDVNI